MHIHEIDTIAFCLFYIQFEMIIYGTLADYLLTCALYIRTCILSLFCFSLDFGIRLAINTSNCPHSEYAQPATSSFSLSSCASSTGGRSSRLAPWRPKINFSIMIIGDSNAKLANIEINTVTTKCAIKVWNYNNNERIFPQINNNSQMEYLMFDPLTAIASEKYGDVFNVPWNTSTTGKWIK